MTRLADWKVEQARLWGCAPWQDFAQAVLGDVHDQLVARLAPRLGEQWLDLATGTGAVALRAARAGARVVAQDQAPQLVHTARRLAAAAGLKVQFDVGDAERLPYGTASFDVVSSAHGVVFAADHAAVAGELARVCRSGGRLGLTYWRPNPGLRALIDRVDLPRPPEADEPRDWAREDYVRGLLDHDFELTIDERVCHWIAESGAQAWRLFSGSDPLATAGLARFSPAERDAFRDAWVEFFEGHRANGVVRVPRPYLLILGRRRSSPRASHSRPNRWL